MVCKTFFLSWKYCTCFWLRVVGVGVMVLRVRVVCFCLFKIATCVFVCVLIL